jgi:hypothetical protein
MVLNPQRRRRALPLAFDHGMLICATGTGTLIGVNRTTPRNRWTYKYPRLLSEAWAFAAPVVSDGRVVCTPPDAEVVLCVQADDGTFCWKADKRDGDLYLAGVYAGKVLLVGKDACRALDLKTGKQLWKLPTGLPSGRGFAADDRYYLPLQHSLGTTQPEICTIDLVEGEVVARTRSRSGETLGNLLMFGDCVYSQSATELVAYPQLSVKLRDNQKRLAKAPTDPAALIERADLLMEKGDLQGAIEDLRLALANKPAKELAPKARRQLHEALTLLFRRDFRSAQQYQKEYESLIEEMKKYSAPPKP